MRGIFGGQEVIWQEHMSIQMIGIDHNLAGIDVRMIFSFTKKCMAEALEQLKQVRGIEGCVMLSTCNRMELWVSTNETCSVSLYELLCEIRQVPAEMYRAYFSFREGREAVRHLFRLAGGLESRILGEDQIVTQVGEALTFAREQYATDHVMETLFRMAVTAAKKVKTDVVLSPADNSVVRTAIETLKGQGKTFAGKRCMVIGNGVMGKLSATMLRAEGADVTVTVRQYRSGIVEIPRGCKRIDYGLRMSLFGQCDYVVSATVSPNYTLTRELVEQELDRPVVLIDLAVPRDIDPTVRELPQVELYDIDCFREEARSEQQKAAIAKAETCLLEQMEEFFDWYEGRDVIPRIQGIKEAAARDLEARLSKKLQHLSVEENVRENLKQEIFGAAQRAVNKLLFGLRDEVSRQTFLECLDGLESVYGEAEEQDPGNR